MTFVAIFDKDCIVHQEPIHRVQVNMSFSNGFSTCLKNLTCRILKSLNGNFA